MREANSSTVDTHPHQWTEIIEPQSRLLDLRLGEVWRYRDLVLMFVRRDFVANYKQTILGPIWFFVQPLLTTITFVLIFGRIARLSPEGVPMILFYLAGVTLWSYFSESLTKTATVFKDNAQMLGKVYFPRLTMPFSIVLANLIRFGIQFSLFLIIWLYFCLFRHDVHPNAALLLLPVLVLLMGLLSLGLGMIISAMTTKYRDLIFLLTFGIQLLMYAAPVIYPLSSVTSNLRFILLANPMTPIIETFRYGFLGAGAGVFSWNYLLYSAGATIAILILGTIIFNKVEKKFTDTV